MKRKIIGILICMLLIVSGFGSYFGIIETVDAETVDAETTEPTTFYSTNSDGYIEFLYPADYYTTWNSQAGLVYDTGNSILIGQQCRTDVPVYFILRGFVFFDSSSIPDDATIVSATLSLYGSYAGSAHHDFDIVVQNGQPNNSPHDPLILWDYYKGNYSGDGGSLNTVDFTTSGYNDITLNLSGKSWINKQGITKLCLRSSRDINGDQPQPRDYEYIRIYSSEEGGNYRPKLTVEYTQNPPGDPSNLDAHNPTQNSIDLSWAKGSGSDKTKIMRKIGSYPNSPTDSSATQVYFDTGTFTKDTGLNPSTTYYYRAWAYDSNTGLHSDGYDSDSEKTKTPPRTITFSTDPSNGGTITFDSSSYNNGDSTSKSDGTYSASANPATTSYVFDHWSSTGGVSVTNPNSASTSATISGDGTLKAWFTYSPPQYTINFQTDPTTGGSILFNGVQYYNGQSTTVPGGTYSITGNPSTNYVFDHWTSTCGNVANSGSQSTTVTVNSNGNLKAWFTLQQPVDWTAIILLCGDNNLEYWMNRYLNYITSVTGTGQDVNIVVLIDREGTSDTNAYYIDSNSQRVNIPLRNIDAGWINNEVNMGNPQTLISFSNYCADNYPADDYLLILSDHGGMWYGCFWDDTSNDNLDINDMGLAFNVISSHIGKKIDVVFLNDCLLNSIEIANQIQPYVEYQTGAETIMHGTTCDSHYTTILQHLINNPTITPQNLANYITNNQLLINNAQRRTCSLSNIDLNKIPTLKIYVNDLSQDLRGKLDNEQEYNKIFSARNACEYTYGAGGIERIIDLYDFASEINSRFTGTFTAIRAQNIMNQIGAPGGENGKAVIRERHTTAADFCHGISIYFPDRASRFDSDYIIGNNFASDTSWDEFINEFYNPSFYPSMFCWDASIEATSNDAETHGEYFTFGEQEDATDGYDNDIDYYHTVTQTDINIYSKIGDEKYFVDIRNGPATSKTWDVYLEWTGSGSTTIKLIWDTSLIPTSEYQSVILYDVGNDVEIDMRTSNIKNVQMSSNELRHFKIICNKNEPLVADAGGPYFSRIGEDIVLTGASTGGVPPYTFEWDLDEDGIYDKTGKTITCTWDNSGEYIIWLKVTDQDETEATDDTIVTIKANNPPYTPGRPSGPSDGEAGKEYIYSGTTFDPEEDPIYYIFDWGDGTNSGWVGIYLSGETGSASHKWTEKGEYQIKVKAKDVHGAESDWSDPLPISMPVPYEPEELTAVLTVSSNTITKSNSEITFYASDSYGVPEPIWIRWDIDGETGWDTGIPLLDHWVSFKLNSKITYDYTDQFQEDDTSDNNNDNNDNNDISDSPSDLQPLGFNNDNPQPATPEISQKTFYARVQVKNIGGEIDTASIQMTIDFNSNNNPDDNNNDNNVPDDQQQNDENDLVDPENPVADDPNSDDPSHPGEETPEQSPESPSESPPEEDPAEDTDDSTRSAKNTRFKEMISSFFNRLAMKRPALARILSFLQRICCQ